MFIPVVAESYKSTEWQEEDLRNHLASDYDYSADWSEMGLSAATRPLLASG
jgi:hypothetical protein